MQLLPSIQIGQLLSSLDIAIVIASVLTTLGVGWYGATRRANSGTSVADYLIMGRRLTLPLFTMSLVASWYGGIFGVTAIAYESGFYNFVTQGLFWYGTYIFFALVLVKPVASYRAMTVPELVSQIYGDGAGKVAAVFNFFNMLPVAYSLSLGLFVQQITGLDLVFSIFVGTGFVVLYSAFGGDALRRVAKDLEKRPITETVGEKACKPPYVYLAP